MKGLYTILTEYKLWIMLFHRYLTKVDLLRRIGWRTGSGRYSSASTAWKCSLQLVIEAVDQSITGLCMLNQGRPRTTCDRSEEISRGFNESWWFSNRVSDKGMVMCETLTKNLQSMAKTSLGSSRDTVGILFCPTKLSSIKFPSAPKSTKAWIGIESSEKGNTPRSWIWNKGLG